MSKNETKERLLFSESELSEVEKAIARAEEKTSGEIVPLVVFSSHSYLWVYGLLAALGWGLGTLALAWYHFSSPFSLTLLETFFWQATAVALLVVLPRWPGVKRFLVPRVFMAKRVHRQALANFFAMGLHETRDRTGVLIYISLLEHRVEILADRGIHAQVPGHYWDEQVSLILQGLKTGTPAQGLIRAIDSMGAQMAERFPPRPDDQNEVGDKVRFGHQVWGGFRVSDLDS